MLIDHIDLRVADFAHDRPLYDALLPAMGYSDVAEEGDYVCYYRPGGDRSAPFFCLNAEPGHRPNGSRVALRAASRAEVDRLAAVARGAGAAAFEGPEICEEYTPFYYAAFFEDAAGNKLEICYRAAPN